VHRYRTLAPPTQCDGLLEESLSRLGFSARTSDDTPLTTGLADVDRVTGGGLVTGVHLVTGAPGAGRTALLHRLLTETCRSELSTLLVVRQGAAATHVQRLVSGLSAVARHEMTEFPDQHRERIAAAAGELQAWHLAIVETDQLELWALGWAVAQLENQVGRSPRLLLIDDIDQLAGSQPLADVAASLAGLAREQALVTVATTTATDRAATGRSVADWAPMAPHLRSAWVVHREELDDPETTDRGIGELHLIWQADGPTGTVRLAFTPHLAGWADLARPNRPTGETP